MSSQGQAAASSLSFPTGAAPSVPNKHLPYAENTAAQLQAACTAGILAQPRTSEAGGVLFLFAKYPRAGTVKTRLQPTVGVQGAGVIARAFILDICHRLAGWSARCHGSTMTDMQHGRAQPMTPCPPTVSLIVLAAPAPTVPLFEAMLASEGAHDCSCT